MKIEYIAIILLAIIAGALSVALFTMHRDFKEQYNHTIYYREIINETISIDRPGRGPAEFHWLGDWSNAVNRQWIYGNITYYEEPFDKWK